MIDDLLDYRGRPGKDRQKVGNDLAEGKMTLPLILTVQHADRQDRDRLQAIVGDETGRRQGLEEVCGLIAKYDGFTMTRTRAEQMGGIGPGAARYLSGRDCAQEKAVSCKAW